MISIIIPVYRVEADYFNECMASVLNQSYEDLEIILVDDGAAAFLPELCDKYASKDSRVKVIHQKNAGASAARNAGLLAASGEYVTFVDSDDYIHRDNIKEAAERAKRDNLDVLIWGSYKCYGERREDYMPYSDDITLFDDEMKQQLMYKTMVGWLSFYKEPATHSGSGSCCSKLYRRDFLNKNDLKYPVGIKRAEDVNFNIRVFDAAERIGYLNRQFYFYRQLDTSATYQYRENGISIFTDALMCLKEFLDSKKRSDMFYQVFYMRCVFFFLESMDMDYFNPANKNKLSVKLKGMRSVVMSEPYKEALNKIELKHLSMARKIPVVLMRKRHMLLLAVFYSVYRKLKG